jgi:hypothetical protein
MIVSFSPRAGRMLAAGAAMATVLTATVLTAAVPAATASASVHPHAASTGRLAPGTVLPLLTRVLHAKTLKNSHWSGYDATTGSYTAVAATFTQPAVNCSKGGDVVFWTGLGGGTATSNSLQQNGTFAECSGGSPVYLAWWERWPCNAITQYGGTVKAGDKITATSVDLGSNKYKLTVADATQKWTATRTVAGCNGGSKGTAEVVTETPEIGGGLADLPDFGTVTYTGATINGKPLADAKPAKVIMARSGVTMDSTSAITGGDSFSNTWQAGS